MQMHQECQACMKALAKHTCKMCGRHVCENCFNSVGGICVLCGHGKKVKK